MTRTGLLLVLAALVAGGAIGYVVGTTTGSPPDIPTVGPVDSGLVTPREQGRTVVGPRRGDPVAPAPFPEPLPAGSGAITGHVTLADGRPLAGVIVRATPRPPEARKRKGHGPTEPDLVTAVRRHEARLRFERTSRRETTTDDAGRYMLTGIADAEYRVEAFREGHDCEPRGKDRETFGPGDVVSFVAVPITDLRLSVLLPDGTEAEKARIELSKIPAGRGFTPTHTVRWTRRDPVLQLEPGGFRLTAEGGPDRDLRSDETTIVIEAGTPPEALTLRLAPRPGIRGRVRFPPGFPGLEAKVHALRIAPGAEVPDERILVDGEELWLDPDSETYSYIDIEPGTWIVVVSTGKGRVVRRAEFEITTRTAIQDFELPPPEPGDALILRVEAPDGTLLRDVSIETAYVCPRYSSSGGGQATLLPDGTYRVQHHDVETSRLEIDGSYVVEVHSREYGVVSRKYDADETTTLTVRFGNPAVLEVRLSGYLGSPHEGAIRLGLSRSGGGGIRESVTTPDAEGRHEFEPCPPGEYRLLVGMKDGRWARWVTKVAVTLAPGANVETIAVPPLHELLVIADGIGADAKLGLRLEGGDVSIWIAGRAPENGCVRFDRLPAGRHVVFSSGEEPSGEMVVVLGGSATIRFEAQTMNALHVKIRDPDGHLGRAGLREGDLVVAIDGEEIVDRERGRALLATARKKETARLTILRGRAKLEVSVAPKKTRGKEAGDSLLPAPRSR